jgi:HSP20 family protein
MSTGRWDPLGDIVSLREAMNNLLEESFVRPRGETPGTPAGLAVDVRETNDAYVVTASVPGVAASDVDISVLGDTLRIRGQRHETHENTGEPGADTGRWLIRERRFGAFERSITLPSAIMAAGANADFKDGVLTITLPKAEEAKPRSIPVRNSPAAVSAGTPTEIEVESKSEEQTS